MEPDIFLSTNQDRIKFHLHQIQWEKLGSYFGFCNHFFCSFVLCLNFVFFSHNQVISFLQTGCSSKTSYFLTLLCLIFLTSARFLACMLHYSHSFPQPPLFFPPTNSLYFALPKSAVMPPKPLLQGQRVTGSSYKFTMSRILGLSQAAQHWRGRGGLG